MYTYTIVNFKKINPKENRFYYLELGDGKYCLYDSEFDMPISYGSKNLVENKIRQLNSNIELIHYRIIDGIFKLKYLYKEKKQEN